MPAATRRKSTTQPMQQRAASKKKGSGQKPGKKKGAPSSTLPIFKQLVSEYGEKVLVYTYHSKKFKCEWQDEYLPVLAMSSETTPSSKLPGWSFETPLEWCCAIHYEATGTYTRKISPKRLLFYQDRSLFEWQLELDMAVEGEEDDVNARDQDMRLASQTWNESQADQKKMCVGRRVTSKEGKESCSRAQLRLNGKAAPKLLLLHDDKTDKDQEGSLSVSRAEMAKESDKGKSTSKGKRKQSAECLEKQNEDLKKRQGELEKRQLELEQKLRIVEGELGRSKGETLLQNTHSIEVQQKFKILGLHLVNVGAATGMIDCEAMQHVTLNVFKYAGMNLEEKLQQFHAWHSHEGKIHAYDENFKSRIENLFLPELCNEGVDADGGLCVCERERE
mmetsp:Transcript_61833/g.100033  ORF Transcript_61833/g.100033 Transcript_61833/m.100033 type:complete len:391 (-) Transcript_61833:168-1340(-)